MDVGRIKAISSFDWSEDVTQYGPTVRLEKRSFMGVQRLKTPCELNPIFLNFLPRAAVVRIESL